MKLAVISNSHAGALNVAWQAMKANYSDINITFFAAAGDLMKELVVRDNYLTAASEKLKNSIHYTSNGADKIFPNEYDFIFIYGLNAGIYYYRGIFYSNDFLEFFLKKIAQKSISWKVLEKIRSISNTPIVIGHNPLLAAERNNDVTADNYLSGIEYMNNYIYKKCNALYIPQPTITVVNGYNTDIQYSKGSTKLDIGKKIDNIYHDDTDMSHMNGEFANLYLNNLFLTLKDAIKLFSMNQPLKHESGISR